jgi:predicted site-specific integrase-resolvase
MVLVKGGVASRKLGVTLKTLRNWEKAGKIHCVRTPGDTRLYDVDAFLASARAVDTVAPSGQAMDTLPGLSKCQALDQPAAAAPNRVDIAYCRVSSAGQKADLARQVLFLEERCPGAEIIKDVGSGLNFKRKGLRTLLERVLEGTVRSVTVAHRDRLCRFGFELIKWILERQQVRLVVLNDHQQSPEAEFTEDLLAIVHVFSCRFNGLRRYRQATQEAVENEIGDSGDSGDSGDRGDAGDGRKRRRLPDAKGPPASVPRTEPGSTSLDGRC